MFKNVQKVLPTIIITTIILFFIIISLFIPEQFISFAQESENLETLKPAAIDFIIKGDSAVVLNQTERFRLESENPIPENWKIEWIIENNKTLEGEEISTQFTQLGNTQLRVRLTSPDRSQFEIAKEIFVYRRSLFLFSSSHIPKNRLKAIQQSAEDENVLLNFLQVDVNFRSKKAVLKQIEKLFVDLMESETIIIWSDRIELLTLLNSFSSQIDFSQKDIAVITDGNIALVENLMIGVQEILKPKRIIITRREALDEFFLQEDMSNIVDVLDQRAYDIRVISQESLQYPWWQLPRQAVQFLQEKGAEERDVLLLLLLPVIVTLVTFLKLVIGLSSVGARIPILLTYAFFILGIKTSLVFITVLAFISYAFRVFLFKSHLLYTAKVGVLTSSIALVVLCMLIGGAYFNLVTPDFSSIFMLIIIATIIDRIAGAEGEKGALSILRIVFETILIALISFLVISLTTFQLALLSYPAIVLLFIITNILIGRFTGLRLLEYFRFREILRYTEE